MLIRRGLTTKKIATSAALLVGIIVAAGLVWYLNPVKRAQRYYAIPLPPAPKKADVLPKDALDDTRLFNDWELPFVVDSADQSFPFGRPDPFLSLAPPRTATSTATTTPQR